jgi:hypothetical protein
VRCTVALCKKSIYDLDKKMEYIGLHSMRIWKIDKTTIGKTVKNGKYEKGRHCICKKTKLIKLF